MQLLVQKSTKQLLFLQGTSVLYTCRIALGREPNGAKQKQGDGKTPEGIYYICLVKKQGKYGRSLGLSYPNVQDAKRGFKTGLINQQAFAAILLADTKKHRPPWGTALGGEIYIHEGGTQRDWTEGCIALETADMDRIYPEWEHISHVEIVP